MIRAKNVSLANLNSKLVIAYRRVKTLAQNVLAQLRQCSIASSHQVVKMRVKILSENPLRIRFFDEIISY
jgi:hypothetical protein